MLENEQNKAEKETEKVENTSGSIENSTTSSNEKTEEKVSDEQENQDSTAVENEKTQQTAAHEKEEAEEEAIKSSDDEEEVEDEYYGILVKAYDEMNLDALGEELDRLLKDHEVKKIRQHVREIKAEFDLKFGKERREKKKEFLEKVGNIIDFSYSTETERKFNKLYFEYKEKRDNYYKSVRKNLQENLERRLAIIEELKSITG